jgi:carbon storage regulator
MAGKVQGMLVLTRKTNERIVLGADCVVTVIAIRGDRVQLGVEAPRNVIVDREEVHWRRVKEARSKSTHERREARPSARQHGTG